MNPSTPPCEIPPVFGSRREFLTCLAGVAALGAVPFAAIFAGRYNGTPPTALGAPPCPVAIPGLAAFLPHLGSVFVSAAAGAQPAIHFTLARAEALKQRHVGAGESFSLRFAVPSGHLIESRIYRIQHPVLGSLELFISPVGSAGKFSETQNGEAVVNQLARRS